MALYEKTLATIESAHLRQMRPIHLYNEAGRPRREYEVNEPCAIQNYHLPTAAHPSVGQF